MGAADREMEVDPWAVVLRHSRWYLLCWSHTRQERRVLRLDRIVAIEIPPATFTPPDDRTATAPDRGCGVGPDGTRGSRGSPGRELDDPRASSPGQVQVPVAGVAVLIHVNPAEAGECRIRGRHVCVCRDDVGLSGQSLDLCQPDLSLEPEGHRLACHEGSGPSRNWCR